jgi:hypothetical protein
MNSEAIRRAMNEAFRELKSLDNADFVRLIQKHEDGPITQALIESGMFEGRVAEARMRERLFDVSLQHSVAFVNQTEAMPAEYCLTPLSSYGAIIIASSRTLSKRSGWNSFVISERTPKSKQLAWAA